MPRLPAKDNPTILEPPAEVREELAGLEAALDAAVPAKVLDR